MPSAATDLFGVSGRRMPKAIVKESDMGAGWRLCAGNTEGQAARSGAGLEGTFKDDQRWFPDKELLQVEWLEAQAGVLEQEIERRMLPFERTDPPAAHDSGPLNGRWRGRLWLRSGRT
ncbi:MAG: hypothetical protein QOJ99_5555 [Bryobacterales bacterium]|nr:hypothetical protein [Bryobacterales bacterium]MEA2475743.1 hypothetical protein [Thermoleophilaceae bacterium]